MVTVAVALPGSEVMLALTRFPVLVLVPELLVRLTRLSPCGNASAKVRGPDGFGLRFCNVKVWMCVAPGTGGAEVAVTLRETSWAAAVPVTVTGGENSEVLPKGSVAVAVIKNPDGTGAGKDAWRLKEPLPWASVVRAVRPRKNCPSRFAVVLTTLAKTSIA